MLKKQTILRRDFFPIPPRERDLFKKECPFDFKFIYYLSAQKRSFACNAIKKTRIRKIKDNSMPVKEKQHSF